jgi:hypothetical protein
VDPSAVIALARECNIPFLQPMAFYELSCHLDEWVIDKLQSPLDHEGVVSLARVRELLAYHLKKFGGKLGDQGWNCGEALSICRESVFVYWVRLLGETKIQYRTLDVLREEMDALRRPKSDGRRMALCVRCRLKMADKFDRVRNRIFMDLHGMFGIDIAYSGE